MFQGLKVTVQDIDCRHHEVWKAAFRLLASSQQPDILYDLICFAVSSLDWLQSLARQRHPPEQRLTEADAAPLAATLRSLHWTTCTQRLVSGSSLLGRTQQQVQPLQVHLLPTPRLLVWCLGISQTALSISGLHFGGAVLSAPVLEVLSSSIGSCMHLQQLYIHSLGVPVLPESLAQLPLLHTVSIASTTMARRMVVAADRALPGVGICTSLRDLTLAGKCGSVVEAEGLLSVFKHQFTPSCSPLSSACC